MPHQFRFAVWSQKSKAPSMKCIRSRNRWPIELSQPKATHQGVSRLIAPVEPENCRAAETRRMSTGAAPLPLTNRWRGLRRNRCSAKWAYAVCAVLRVWQLVMPLIKLLDENYVSGFVLGTCQKIVKQTSALWHLVSRWLFIKSGLDLIRPRTEW